MIIEDRYNMSEEHPSFIKAKSLPEPWREHFPKNIEEANQFQKHIRYRALASKVIAVAVTRIECAWACYIDAVDGQNHELEYLAVVHHGSKLMQEEAEALFPEFKIIPYAN